VHKRVILIVILLVAIAFAGCLGSGEENKKEEPPKLVQKHGTMLQMSGWAESNWADTNEQPWLADIDIGLTLNHTNIIQVKFKMRIEDSDSAHTETDQGSDPDDVTATANGGNVTSDVARGTTPATLNIEVKATATSGETDYLSQSWVVHLHADCNGGKQYKIGPIPIPGMQYKDQGVAWTLDGEYTYMAEEIT
jgi:hypothetical protein